MGEHHALGLAGRAGSVDDGGELAGEDLRGAHAVGGDLCASRGGDQRFVAKALGGDFCAGVGNDDVFKLRKAGAAGQEFLQLRCAAHDDDFRAGVIEDVGHAVG